MRLPRDRARTALREAGVLVEERGTFPCEIALVTDTRGELRGRVFLALRGERFDGNAYAREAATRGAAGLLLEDARVAGRDVPCLIVTDAIRAYLALAGLARELACERGARVAAITGSAGKTTTKEFLVHLVRACARVAPERIVATYANENNEIGVAKLLTGLPEDAAYILAEFGARKPHDIAPLAAAAEPSVAVVTNVGDAHLEIFGSRENVAATKFEIVERGAHAIINAENPVSRARVLRDPALAQRTSWFAGLDSGCALPQLPGALVALRRVDSATCEVVFRSREGVERRVATPCGIPGVHNLVDAAAALAALRALGLGTGAAEKEALAALGTLVLPQGRYERGRAGELSIIFDAYNASPDGMLAALATFAREPAGRRIAVLGSMAELGAESPAAHRRVGAAAAAAALDLLLLGGAYAADLAEGAHGAGMPNERIVYFGDTAAAATILRARARRGDLVFFKASRASRLEEIVEQLRAFAF